MKQTNTGRVQETKREMNSTSSKCLCKRRLSKYQAGYGQIRYLIKRPNTVLTNKLQENKPSRFYSVRNAEKLQHAQKKGRLTNPSQRPKKQRRQSQKNDRMTTSKSLPGMLHRNKRKTTETVPKHFQNDSNIAEEGRKFVAPSI